MPTRLSAAFPATLAARPVSEVLPTSVSPVSLREPSTYTRVSASPYARTASTRTPPRCVPSAILIVNGATDSAQLTAPNVLRQEQSPTTTINNAILSVHSANTIILLITVPPVSETVRAAMASLQPVA